MDSLLKPVLPKGLKVCRQGQSLETAASNAGDVSLLATSRGLEAVRGTLKKGYRLHIYPAEDGCQPTEVYYLLHGSLGFDSPEGPHVLETRRTPGRPRFARGDGVHGSYRHRVSLPDFPTEFS